MASETKTGRGMTRDELKAVALAALRKARPDRAARSRVAFRAIQFADPLTGTSYHPHGVNYAQGIAELAHEAVVEYGAELLSKVRK
jgi:hypothetical protein